MNVLYVFATLPVGGAEEHLVTILKGIDRARFTPLVCCIGEKGALGMEIEAMGVEVISLHRMKNRSWDWGAVKGIARIIRKRGIDVVHTHLYHANMYGRVAALPTSTPVLATEHNVYPRYKLKRRVINRVLFSLSAGRVIAVSNAVREYIVKRDWLDAKRVVTVHNGIDVKRFSMPLGRPDAKKRIGVPEDCPVVGTVGRLAPQKGHVYLIRAMHEVLKKMPQARLVIAGSGPIEDGLRKEADAFGMGDSVVFLGARRDIPEVLTAFDVYVQPSLWEGLPMAVVEAMSSGLPIVATRVGGLAELVMDGHNGILVKPCDEDALGNAVMGLLSDAGKAREFGARGRELAQGRFSAERMVSALTSLYEEVVHERACRG